MVEWRCAAFPISNSMTFIARIFIASFLMVSGSAPPLQLKILDSESPTWSIQALAEPGPARAGITELPVPGAGVLFSADGNNLIVYGVDQTVSGASITAEHSLEHFSLHLLLLDSASGKLVSRKEEKTQAREAAIFTTSGGLMVKTGGRLELYSSDLVQQRPFPFLFERDSGVKVSVSATGNTIMLNEVIQDSVKQIHSHFDVLDAATLNVKYSWNQSPPLYHRYSISDDVIAAADDFIAVTRFGASNWTQIARKTGLCPSQNMPTLISDRELVYGCDRLVVASTDGNVLMTEAIPKGDSPAGKTVAARNGRFFAVALNTLEVRKHFLRESSMRKTATHIAVYDLSLKRQVLSLNINPLPRNYCDFAISPDGSKLAILNDGNVSVYSVPQQLQ